MKTIEMKQDGPVVLRVERRSRNREELSCEEIMRLARQRGTKARRSIDAEFRPAGVDAARALLSREEIDSRDGRGLRQLTEVD